MRKFKRPITEIIIKHKQEAVSIYFKTTQNLIRVENYINTVDPESRLILYNCNPTQIANELLEWCDEECLIYPCGSVNERVLCIDDNYIRLEHQLRKDELYGFVRHSIPNFKQLLKAELEKTLEREEDVENDEENVEQMIIERIEKLETRSGHQENQQDENHTCLKSFEALLDSQQSLLTAQDGEIQKIRKELSSTMQNVAGHEKLEIESNKHSDAITLSAHILKQAGVEK